MCTSHTPAEPTRAEGMDMQAGEEGVVSVCSRGMMEMSTGHIWTSQKEAMSGLGSKGTADAFPNVAVRPEGVTSSELTSVVFYKHRLLLGSNTNRCVLAKLAS